MKVLFSMPLLSCSSVLINFCRDPRPITDTSDAMSWFIQWENSVKSNEKIRNKEKCLISHQTRQDIISAILGFEELCTYKLKKSNASIIPNRVNSDVIENIFFQQRTMHNAMNSVILGQDSVSRKSNTGGAAGACLSEMSEKVRNQDVHTYCLRLGYLLNFSQFTAS